MKISAIIAVVATLAMAEAPAAVQPVTNLSGRVTDATTGGAITGAQVAVEGTTLGTLTNREGRYTLAVPAPTSGTAQVVLRVVALGYAPATRTIEVGSAAAVADFALEPRSVEVDEVTVEAEVMMPRMAPGEGAGGRVQDAPSAPVTPVGALARARVLSARYEDFSVRPYDRRTAFDPEFEREGYDRIYENPFLAAGPNPLSTFAIDVDRASYSNVRRFLNYGELPPADAVRIEELINYFNFDYPEPQGPHPFAVHTEVAPAPWNRLHRLVKIGLQAKTLDVESLPPSNLVFLLDVSGSMSDPDKLPLLKSALTLLVHELRPQDRVAIVVYAGAAGLVLDSTPGDHKRDILAALDRLEAGGSTAGGAGIRLAYRVARRNYIRGGNNRVILATDGDFNVGASSDAEMVRLIEEKREQGAFLTVLGFGTGNLQDAKMEQLADHGNGNFAYIDGLLEAKKVLVSELGGTLHTIAKDVKIQVEFNPARVKGYRLIGYENRLLAAEDFDDDRKDAGEMGSGHSVTALYEVIPRGVDSEAEIRGLDPLRYQETAIRPEVDDGDELLFVKLRYKRPTGDRSVELTLGVRDEVARPSQDLTFAAAVAAFGMILRGSEHCGATTLRDVARWAQASVGADLEGYRTEFVRMVEMAEELQPDPVPTR